MRAQLAVVPDCAKAASVGSLVHATLRKRGPKGCPSTSSSSTLSKRRKPGVSAEARGFARSPSFCVDGADRFPEAPGGLPCRVYRAVDGRLRGLPDRQALVDRLHHVAQGG